MRLSPNGADSVAQRELKSTVDTCKWGPKSRIKDNADISKVVHPETRFKEIPPICLLVFKAGLPYDLQIR
jgi:hypothetical protein